jgi:PEP-CTERM motif
MRRMLILLCVLAVSSIFASADPLLVTTGVPSPYGTVPVDFGGTALVNPSPFSNNGVTYTGSFDIDVGDLAGVYRSPFGPSSSQTYISVPNAGPSASGSYEITFGGKSFNYFGLYWGSIDTYNTITFYNGSTEIGSFTGTQAALLAGLCTPAQIISGCAAFGDAGSNRFFNFITDVPFDRIVVNSTNFAFESGQQTLGQTPEPGTMALFGSGLATFAAFFRRRFKA